MLIYYFSCFSAKIVTLVANDCGAEKHIFNNPTHQRILVITYKIIHREHLMKFPCTLYPSIYAPIFGISKHTFNTKHMATKPN